MLRAEASSSAAAPRLAGVSAPNPARPPSHRRQWRLAPTTSRDARTSADPLTRPHSFLLPVSLHGKHVPHGWQHYLAGGLLIGTGVSLLFLLTTAAGGRHEHGVHLHLVMGDQAALLQQPRLPLHGTYAAGGWCSRWAWCCVGALVAQWLGPAITLSAGSAAAAGPGRRAVGFGSRLGNSCTSGHGICGLSSLLPSLAAVAHLHGHRLPHRQLIARLPGPLMLTPLRCH